MNSYQISVVIRTFNEEQHVGLLLDTLKSQDCEQNHLELIVIDSGSVDKTVEIVKHHKVDLFETSREEFTYSRALNLGVANSKGDYVIILSAHAIPTDTSWLKGMISHFQDDRVAGVYSRQRPWPDAPWDEKLRLDKTFPSQSCIFTADCDNMHFSNAASCIRRTVWEKHPFVEMPAAEDREWAIWAMRNNYKIVYDSAISVFHSHNETPRKSAHRLIEIAKSVDMRLGRKRSQLMTFKNTVLIGIKDIIKISRYKGCKGRRLHSIRNSISRAFWFYRDFK